MRSTTRTASSPSSSFAAGSTCARAIATPPARAPTTRRARESSPSPATRASTTAATCSSAIGSLPQEPSIFRKLTVRQNFLLVLEGSGLARKAQEERADELLTEFDLLRVADSLGETLSGGERRRTEIARSLLAGPQFMLFDEPFAWVDPIAVGDLQRLIGKLRGKGLGVLITDHNVRETLGICDRAVLLFDGKLLEAGTPNEIAASDRARAVYLGERFKLE